MKEAKIENIDFGSALSERYLAYALSTIMSRSLPDVRDGLKPVHRRLLYAMLQLRLEPNSGYKKCARVVGDVIGKYHPHGDVAVYDTLVRLAQHFSLRYPLIDGQGNFGSIDGDNAAAMRYTESRMTEICTLLMEDIDKDTVDFRPTYDDSDLEPVIMPASFPNLLANGSEGIAVGMATNIPPHNLHELCDALMHLIDHPKAEISDIMNFIKGPDFPTGGIIIDKSDVITSAYMTGRGSFRVRARWEKEELNYGVYQIVVTEIPYQVQKSKLIEQIAILLKDKKIPLVSNIRDESTDIIRLVIEPRDRSCDPQIVMESLFKLTNLESRIQLNMNVIGSNNVPKVMNILEVLQEFLSHRQNIITRRSTYLLNKIKHRLEILEGLRIAYLNLDEIIKIIREEDEPKAIMMQRFQLTEIQVEAILNTRLRSLRKLEEQEIITEHSNLQKQQAILEEILNNPKELWKVVKKEIKAVQAKFGLNTTIGARRTSFEQVTLTNQVVDITAFITKEPITIICSKMGWVRSLKGHNNDLSSIKYKEGDAEKFILEAYTTDKILIISSEGRFFTLLADNISKGKGTGESIKLLVDIGNNDITEILVYKPDQLLLLASSIGKGFVVNSNEVMAQTKSGKQIMNVPDGHTCIACLPVNGDSVACIGESRKLLVFNIDEIPEMKKGQGVTLQKFKNAKLLDIKIFNREDGLSWNSGGKVKLEKNIIAFLGKRGSTGKLPPMGFPKNNRFS
ncbi:DNA topoisomerase IV subunit A [Rickettsia bellii]|uniref:DNA topoisomerase 4 subunit A n=2 Tax=Rickettsia bellii TaxID=33990 RepID=A0A0F3QKM7_RICBE|nr:DNA topoisomerase IV subunit A [Rickettsia bellii]ARD86214.1 DNA topoisomerase IV subunit A [Rickettsia bellii]KJV90267.1 DNA topoisomerase IV, A subunit [Rickettsia bellii str. RML An4]KJV92696.1 DNA topoisomerase IV, A subunit [Rickettsia bellii str. RML Mogi]